MLARHGLFVPESLLALVSVKRRRQGRRKKRSVTAAKKHRGRKGEYRAGKGQGLTTPFWPSEAPGWRKMYSCQACLCTGTELNSMSEEAAPPRETYINRSRTLIGHLMLKFCTTLKKFIIYYELYFTKNIRVCTSSNSKTRSFNIVSCS